MTDTIEFPAESIAELLKSAVPGAIIKDAPWIDMPAIVVDREHVVEVCRALRDEAALQFSFLADLTVVDNHPAEPRFDVVYSLVCVGAAFAQAGGAAPARRLRMKVRLPAHETHIPTVSGIYPAAGWLEREAFDLFGVIFEGHPDLRRLLMADDWEGHPLRKDYPVQIRKDTSSWSAIQMTPEQFAANIQAARDRVRDESDSERSKA